MSKQTIMVSACLLGEPCRYDGKHSRTSELLDLLKNDTIVPACPEVEGDLPIPRPPAEIRGDRVLRENGEDVTHYFQKGAQVCLDKARTNDVSLVILKSRSPSCGCGEIYDGSFTSTVVEGDGIATQVFKSAGIKCISDEHFLNSSS